VGRRVSACGGGAAMLLLSGGMPVIGYVPKRSMAHIQAADPGSQSWSSAKCNLSHFSVPNRPFREREIGNRFWENEVISMALGAIARATVPPFLRFGKQRLAGIAVAINLHPSHPG
jgi:hypothetical protein